MAMNFFNKNDVTAEMVAELSIKQEEAVKGVAGLRSYLESMESRHNHKVGKLLEVIEGLVERVNELSTAPKPQDVVKALGDHSRSEEKLKEFDEVKNGLERAMAKYLVNGRPLTVKKRGRNPKLTKEGEEIYGAISLFVIELAKTAGRKKEYFTHSSQSVKFFTKYGINRYRKMTVSKLDGSNMTTLYAAIIANGHERQYIDFLFSLLDLEKGTR